MISPMTWRFNGMVDKALAREFAGVEVAEREFSCAATVADADQRFYGSDGNAAENLCGYSEVRFNNIYGDRLDKHYGCGHNLYADPVFTLLLRAVGGLAVDSLTDGERESAAKGVACGFLRRDGGALRPKILVSSPETEAAMYDLAADFARELTALAEGTAARLAAVARRAIPKYLRGEYPFFNMLASAPLMHGAIEACVARGLLNAPENRLTAEGSWLVVKK
jgi:hypothetical protein